MITADRAERLFLERYDAVPDGVARAPGRVNIIGDHTDYAEGFVLPIAIDRDVAVAFRARGDGQLRAVSEGFGDVIEVPVDADAPTSTGWGAYLQGVAWALRELGHGLVGVDAAIASDVPVASGLSSSAALELAAARALAAAAALPWDPRAMARACQRAENDWVGVSSGIMDQLVSALGEPGKALLLDCRTLEASTAPLPPGAAVVVCHTGTERTLLDSPYNARRREVDAAARALGVATLRDATPDDLSRLHGVLLRRARHVLSENARTRAAAAALDAGDAAAAGALMVESHASLRDDFEASSPALDAMVQAAGRHPACHGARMTGAGWGGCAVALVRAGGVVGFTDAVATEYRARTGLQPRLYPCTAAAGAGLVAWRAHEARGA